MIHEWRYQSLDPRLVSRLQMLEGAMLETKRVRCQLDKHAMQCAFFRVSARGYGQGLNGISV